MHGASNTSDDIALIRKDKKPDKKFIGLGRKFYGFRNPEEEEAEGLKEFSSLAKAQCDICLVIFHILFTLDSIYLKFRRIIPQSILKSPKVVQSRTTDAQRENSFTARPKIQSQSQIFRYGRSIFCLPHRLNFSNIFDLRLPLSVIPIIN